MMLRPLILIFIIALRSNILLADIISSNGLFARLNFGDDQHSYFPHGLLLDKIDPVVFEEMMPFQAKRQDGQPQLRELTVTPVAPSLHTSLSTATTSTIHHTGARSFPNNDWPEIGLSPDPTSFDAAPEPPSPTDIPRQRLVDGQPTRYVLKSKESAHYILENITQSDDQIVYVTMNVCGEPNGLDTSTKIENQDIRLMATTDPTVARWPFMDALMGFANITFYQTQGQSVYVDLIAPDTSDDDTVSGEWTYEIAVSTTNPVHSAILEPNMNLVDTDFGHALFVTENFTKFSNGSYRENITDYSIYVYKQLEPNPFPEGMSSRELMTIDNRLALSYCGITNGPALLTKNDAWLSTTTRGTGELLKGQIFMNGLNLSTSYIAYLVQPLNMSLDPGTGGGTVFWGVNFTTKTETNCQLIYNLGFCDSIAYAAPGNASIFNPTNLSTFYDDIVRERYQNFSLSLQQIDCYSPLESSFSPFRTCENCASAYKQWLCAISIPRCTDWHKNESYLYPREADSSRNPLINQVIRPGNYKEIPPCVDLCNQLVQNCPSDFGFTCPALDSKWDTTYGRISDDGDVSCSFPGALYYQNVSNRLKPTKITLTISLVVFCLFYFA